MQREVLRLVGRLGRVDRQLPHVLRRGGVGVFEDAGLVRTMRQVLVHTPGLALRARDWDALLRRIVEQIVAALEAVVEDRVSPGRQDLDGRLQGVEGELEADLVVALARTTMRDREAAFLLRDGDLGAGDDGSGEGGAEEVYVLVDGVAGDGWVAQLLDELPIVSSTPHSEPRAVQRTSRRRSST